MRLNGLQRIGVVLSILWAIGAAIYIRSAQVKNANLLFQLEFRACLNERNTSNEICSNRISLQNAMDATAYWPDVAFFAFGPVIIGWLVALITLKTIRWVKTGFSNK
jgi:hypothetical protein